MRLLFVGQRSYILLYLLQSATEISLDSHEHKMDIVSYVERAAARLKHQFELDVGTEARIVNSITARAMSKCKIMPNVLYLAYPIGMFLFAKLVVENLLNQATKNDLLYEIEPTVLPTGLDNA